MPEKPQFVTNKDLDAMVAQAEVFWELHTLTDLVTESEAKHSVVPYLKNIIKARAQQEKNPETGQDCNLCAAQSPRFEKDGEFWHRMYPDSTGYYAVSPDPIKCKGASNAQS